MSHLSPGQPIMYVGVRCLFFETQVFLRINLSIYLKVYNNFLLHSHSLTCHARLVVCHVALTQTFNTLSHYPTLVPHAIFSFQPLYFVHATSSKQNTLLLPLSLHELISLLNPQLKIIFILLSMPIIFFYAYLKDFVFLSDTIVLVATFPVFPPSTKASEKTILHHLSWFLTKYPAQ